MASFTRPVRSRQLSSIITAPSPFTTHRRRKWLPKQNKIKKTQRSPDDLDHWTAEDVVQWLGSAQFDAHFRKEHLECLTGEPVEFDSVVRLRQECVSETAFSDPMHAALVLLEDLDQHPVDVYGCQAPPLLLFSGCCASFNLFHEVLLQSLSAFVCPR